MVNWIGLFDFIINIVSLAIIVSLIMTALRLPVIAPDEWFRSFAAYAVMGAAFLVVLLDIRAAFVGGAGASGAISPWSVIEFAIALIVLVVFIYLIFWALSLFPFFGPAYAPGPFVMAPLFGPSGAAAVPATPGVAGVGLLRYLIGACAIIAILLMAERAIFGGGLGFFDAAGVPHVGGQQQRSVR